MRALLTLLVLCSACTKEKPPPAAVTKPLPAAEPVDAAVPAAPSAPLGAVEDAPPDAGEAAEPAPLDPEAVHRFEADCSAVFETTVDGADGEPQQITECQDPNDSPRCASDPFGCCDQQQACAADCSPACNDCQARCAAACGGCKKLCKKSGVLCVTKCAENRQRCRLDCVAKLAMCRDGCDGRWQTCMREGDAKTARDCPECGAIRECQRDASNDCRAQFPRARPTCFDLCFDGDPAARRAQ